MKYAAAAVVAANNYALAAQGQMLAGSQLRAPGNAAPAPEPGRVSVNRVRALLENIESRSMSYPSVESIGAWSEVGTAGKSNGKSGKSPSNACSIEELAGNFKIEHYNYANGVLAKKESLSLTFDDPCICPEPYTNSTVYQLGDIVTVGTSVYQCNSYRNNNAADVNGPPCYKDWCCNTFKPGLDTGLFANGGWTPLGNCGGEGCSQDDGSSKGVMKARMCKVTSEGSREIFKNMVATQTGFAKNDIVPFRVVPDGSGLDSCSSDDEPLLVTTDVDTNPEEIAYKSYFDSEDEISEPPFEPLRYLQEDSDRSCAEDLKEELSLAGELSCNDQEVMISKFDYFEGEVFSTPKPVMKQPQTAGYNTCPTGLKFEALVANGGTKLSNASDCDNCFEEVELPFTFNFLNVIDASRVWVSSNGQISMTELLHDAAIGPIVPTGRYNNPRIAVAQEDLDPGLSGNIYTKAHVDGSFTISFEHVAYFQRWEKKKEVFVHSPSSISGSYFATSFESGPALNNTGITGYLELVDDGANTTSDACEPLNGFTAGNIAVVDGGACGSSTYLTKIENCQDANAAGIVIVNNVDGAPRYVFGVNPKVTIPVVMISKTDGATIKAKLPGVQATLKDPNPPKPIQTINAQAKLFDDGKVFICFGEGEAENDDYGTGAYVYGLASGLEDDCSNQHYPNPSEGFGPTGMIGGPPPNGGYPKKPGCACFYPEGN